MDGGVFQGMGRPVTNKPPPDKTLALALLIRQAALLLASLIEVWAAENYGFRFRRRTHLDVEEEMAQD